MDWGGRWVAGEARWRREEEEEGGGTRSNAGVVELEVRAAGGRGRGGGGRVCYAQHLLHRPLLRPVAGEAKGGERDGRRHTVTQQHRHISCCCCGGGAASAPEIGVGAAGMLWR